MCDRARRTDISGVADLRELFHTRFFFVFFNFLFLHSCPHLHKGINSPPTSTGGNVGMDKMAFLHPSGLFVTYERTWMTASIKELKKKNVDPSQATNLSGFKWLCLMDGGDHTVLTASSMLPLLSLDLLHIQDLHIWGYFCCRVEGTSVPYLSWFRMCSVKVCVSVIALCGHVPGCQVWVLTPEQREQTPLLFSSSPPRTACGLTRSVHLLQSHFLWRKKGKEAEFRCHTWRSSAQILIVRKPVHKLSVHTSENILNGNLRGDWCLFLDWMRPNALWAQCDVGVVCQQ